MSTITEFPIPTEVLNPAAYPEFKGEKGDKGDQGLAGNGVASIARTAGTGAAGTTDTYTITFTDATTATFDVVNGADGDKGDKGDKGDAGISISSIARTSGDGSAGTTDTYTITFSDATTTTFQVVNGADGEVTLSTAQTLSNKTLANYTESVYEVTGTTPALSPDNGPIQTWALTDDGSPTAGDWLSGQSLTLLVDDGAAHTITWTSLAPVWVTGGGTAPELNTEDYTHLTFWKVGTTIYGARVGDA